MMKMLRKRRKGGFTLIELIVVIAILGILAAIAIPRLGGFTDSGRVRADEATRATLENAAKMYVAANPTLASLAASNLVGADLIAVWPTPQQTGKTFNLITTDLKNPTVTITP